MKTKILFTLICGLLAACTTASSRKTIPEPAAKPIPLIALSAATGATAPITPTAPIAPTAPGEIDALLAYHQRLRELGPAELAKELAAVQAQPKNAQVALKKSMLLTLNHNDGDLARAQSLIDGVVKSTESDAGVVKPLAQMLAAYYGEMRRLNDQSDRLTQQTKESQRRIEQLNKTLEALKAIERSLPTSPNGALAAPLTPVTKGSP